MTLKDPVSIYTAASNMDATLAQRCLENEGVAASVTEDHSLMGYWMFGFLPGIHKPQVWVDRADSERAKQILAKFEQRKALRAEQQAADAGESLDVDCEDCGKTSSFSCTLDGTVQECSHCGSYIDVGEFTWPTDIASDDDDQ